MTGQSITLMLRRKGYRITRQRRRILDALDTHPQSIEELHAILKLRGEAVDRATLYRTLSCLTDLGVVTKTQFRDNTAKFELHPEGDHHHHLVCDRCGMVEDVILNESAILKSIVNNTGFRILSHSLEFFGLCGKCTNV